MAYQPLTLPKKYQTKLDFYDMAFKGMPGAAADFWTSWKPQLTKQLQYNAVKESEETQYPQASSPTEWGDFLGAYKSNKEQAFTDFFSGNPQSFETNRPFWDFSNTGMPPVPGQSLPAPQWPPGFNIQIENQRQEGFF